MRWMSCSVSASFHAKWVCASTSPGMRVAPAPSMTVQPSRGTTRLPGATRSMRLPRMSTSPAKGWAPVPSRMRTLVKRVQFMSASREGGRARDTRRLAGVPRRRGAVELAVLHHREDLRLVLQDADVGKRVAVDEQQVGEETFAHLAQLVAAHHHLAAQLRRREQRLHRAHAEVLHEVLEVARVGAVLGPGEAIVAAGQDT